MSGVLKFFWAFLPSYLQIALLALFALLAIIVVLKIVAMVLDAIPFL